MPCLKLFSKMDQLILRLICLSMILLCFLAFNSFALGYSSRPMKSVSAVSPSLRHYLTENCIEDELANVLVAVAEACGEISNQLKLLPLVEQEKDFNRSINVQGEEQKPMDLIANDIFLSKLKTMVAACASEEEDSIVQGDSIRRYEIAFDPLDGSSNLDVSVPTGTIFGIAQHSPSHPFSSSGRSLKAAGYAIYSSCTELVISLGKEVVGFTLHDDTFRISRPQMVCPPRGPYYSLNEAREPDWPEGLRRWINDAKRGNTPAQTLYSSRYVCSLCADVHRTILKGGWAGNPRPHLRLLYEAAPLAFVMEAAGGLGSDGDQNLLDIVPSAGLHDRVCVFLGSKLDVEDLIAYGDVQQKSRRYNF